MAAGLIRQATAADAAVIHRFIVELAVYEREPDAVDVTAEALAEQIGTDFDCLIAEEDGEPVGFALFFANYSTWRGRPGLFLEDLFVSPDARGRGHGLALLKALAERAVARGCGRMEWNVLDWNAPAIAFYERIGASPLSEWTTYRLTGEALETLGRQAVSDATPS